MSFGWKFSGRFCFASTVIFFFFFVLPDFGFRFLAADGDAASLAAP